MKKSQKSSFSPRRRGLYRVRNITTTTIPFDLIIEILSRLPAKSLLRFQSVSKLWFTTIRSKTFVGSFLTKSKTRPRLLYAFERKYPPNKFLLSTPEYDNNYDDKSSSVIARYHMKIARYDVLGGSVNGFVCFRSVISSNPDMIAITVYNPTTRQIMKLPDLTSDDDSYMKAFLGYDPVEDQYKVLCVIMFVPESQQQEYLVCTVSSSQEQEWRKIENRTGDNNHRICGETCIDGALYYGVGQSKIARFDVRSEKIEFIKTPEEAPIWIACNLGLMNYNGKLGCLYYSCTNNLMTLWVLEDVEKQEWSRMTYDLPDQWVAATLGVGTMTEGVIRFGVSMSFRLPFRVCYYDFNKKNTREVEIRGMEKDGGLKRIRGSGELTGNTGHIENIRFL